MFRAEFVHLLEINLWTKILVCYFNTATVLNEKLNRSIVYGHPPCYPFTLFLPQGLVVPDNIFSEIYLNYAIYFIV